MTRTTIRIEDETIHTKGPLSLVARRLRGGVSDGVLAVELAAGPTRVVVLPDRGLGIWRLVVGETTLGWQSPVQGPVHPRFVPLMEPGGLGWLDGFDELVARCGLASNGAPDFDAQGRLLYPLHGRIANLPARDVEVTFDEAAGSVTVSGCVAETRFLVQDLRLHSAITVRADRPGVAWTDRVENHSDRPAAMQMVYHVNFGPPLLGAGAECLADVEELVPRDAAAARDAVTWNRYVAPQAGRGEQVHFTRVREAGNGRAEAILAAADGSHGARLSWRAAELPCFTLWKNQGGLADGYVTGFEPGTNYPNQRSFEETQGRVVTLAPHASMSFDLAIDVVDAATIRAARGKISPPARVHTEPQAGWTR